MRSVQNYIVGADQTAFGFNILPLRKEAADMKKIISIVVILGVAGLLGCGEAQKHVEAAEAKAKSAVEEAKKTAEAAEVKVKAAVAEANPTSPGVDVSYWGVRTGP